MKTKSLIAACLIVPTAVTALAVYLYANQAGFDSGLKQYQAWVYLGLILVLIGSFAAVWFLERQETMDHPKNQGSDGEDAAVARPVNMPSEHQIYWLTNKMEKRKSSIARLLVVMAVTLVAGSVMALKQQEETPPELVSLGLMSFVFLLITIAFFGWLAHSTSLLKLGVIGKSLVLQNGDRRTIASAGEITYTRGHLMADNIIITLGNYRHSLFDHTELYEYVFPRLKDARKCGRMEMIKHLWRARDPLLLASLILSAVIAAMFIAIALAMPR